VHITGVSKPAECGTLEPGLGLEAGAPSALNNGDRHDPRLHLRSDLDWQSAHIITQFVMARFSTL